MPALPVAPPWISPLSPSIPQNVRGKWPHLADGLQGTAGGSVPLRVALCFQAECLGEDRSREDPPPPKEPCMGQGSPPVLDSGSQGGASGKQGLPEGSCLDPAGHLQSTKGLCTSGRGPCPWE